MTHCQIACSKGFAPFDTDTREVQTKDMKSQYQRLTNTTFQQLRSEMTYAREVYEFARLKFEAASQQAHELGLSTSDGTHALHVAARQYRYFLRQYNKTVKRLAWYMRTGTTQP